MGGRSDSATRGSIIGKLWLPLVVVLVLVAVAYGVGKVRAASETISHPPEADAIVATVVPINPKNITYEVFGDLGAGGKVVYADLEGRPVEVALTALPWSHSATTMAPSATLSLVTQVDGAAVGCRILVNGKVRDEQSITHPAAAAACTVTAA